MSAVLRGSAFLHGAGGKVACRVHETDIHWNRGGRPLQEVVTEIPSIHMAWGGMYGLGVDDRTVRLDDDVLLILNGGHTITSRGRRDADASLLSIYFAPSLIEQALERLSAQERALLPSRQEDSGTHLFEHIREADGAIASVMRYVAHHVDRGVDEASWCEEQVGFLLDRVLANEVTLAQHVATLPCKKMWRRREMYQRLTRVTDLIHTSYERQFTMADLAAAARWSPFHMMREFKTALGSSPYEYLQRRRTQVALRLLSSTELTVAEISEQVGFTERSTMLRRLRREHGLGPRALRAIKRADRDTSASAAAAY